MRKRVMSQAHGRPTVALTAVLGCLFGTPPALAQGGVTIEVGECVKLASPAERLECYERQVNASEAQKAAAATTPAAAPTPNPAPIAAPPGAPAAAAAPAAVAPAAPSTASSPAAAPATPSPSYAPYTKPPLQEVTGTITALRKAQPNSWVITLDNGQVWNQSFPEPYTLEPGMQVTLRPSKWGSAYRLSAAGLNGFIQVRRVK